MNDDFHDPIIDSLLDEVLGGQEPPDLTEEILRKFRDDSQPEENGSTTESKVVIELSKKHQQKQVARKKTTVSS